MSEHRLREGGVLRCCEATLVQRAKNGGPPTEGEVLPCNFGCNDGGLVYRDGAWEWIDTLAKPPREDGTR